MDLKEDTQKKIRELEEQMLDPSFWKDKEKAQKVIAELNELKMEADGVGRFDSGNTIISIYSGAGGDDAEDFSRILFEMYQKYIAKKGWSLRILHEHVTDLGGYRNVVFEVEGKGAYGTLKNESGVHRLVRISPFNAKKKRHTSFSLVEVVPQLPKVSEIEIPEDELEIQFTRSSGPGGQNVNKRETAVRVVHKPSNISVHVDAERSQAQNKEKALEILSGKLYKLKQERHRKELAGLSVGKETAIEWGSQIRSYVLHPYQMVKDHRTNVEVRDVDKVLEGELDLFIDAEKNLE